MLMFVYSALDLFLKYCPKNAFGILMLESPSSLLILKIILTRKHFFPLNVDHFFSQVD